MDNSFVKAAMSYFGLAETSAHVADVLFEAGQIVLAVRVPLSDVDMMGVLDRMKVMQEPAPEQVYAKTEVWTPSREQLREQYNALPKQERSQYGSFHNYCAAGGIADPFTKVELPAHVYLSPAEATPQQKAMAIGRDEKGNYAIAVEDLTDDWQLRNAARVMQALHPVPSADQLRAEYVQRTMDAHARLNGADGKPTSNADDFGGVPG